LNNNNFKKKLKFLPKSALSLFVDDDEILSGFENNSLPIYMQPKLLQVLFFNKT
jgi:hypothetical protein